VGAGRIRCFPRRQALKVNTNRGGKLAIYQTSNWKPRELERGEFLNRSEGARIASFARPGKSAYLESPGGSGRGPGMGSNRVASGTRSRAVGMVDEQGRFPPLLPLRVSSNGAPQESSGSCTAFMVYSARVHGPPRCKETDRLHLHMDTTESSPPCGPFPSSVSFFPFVFLSLSLSCCSSG
jgi:hypothetical protein